MGNSDRDSDEEPPVELTSELPKLRYEARALLNDLDRIQLADLSKHLYSSAILDASGRLQRKRNWTYWPIEQAPVPRDAESPDQAIRDALNDTLQREIAKKLHAQGLQMCLDPEPELSVLTETGLVDGLDMLLHHDANRTPMTWQQIPASGPAKERLERLFAPETLQKYENLE